MGNNPLIAMSDSIDVPNPTTVVLADDHGIVREGIAAKFREHAELKVIGECSDGETAVEMILALKPDFAILDLNMPRLSGAEVVRRLRNAQSATKLIILSISREENVIRDLFRAGAD